MDGRKVKGTEKVKGVLKMVFSNGLKPSFGTFSNTTLQRLHSNPSQKFKLWKVSRRVLDLKEK